MIDFIKITIRDFQGNLENCDFKSREYDPKSGAVYENYFLANDSDIAIHKMKVRRIVGRPELIVEGSIRKWATMRDTLLDLTAKSFERAIKKLALKLKISFEDIYSATFTKCEIGMNIKPETLCEDIIPLFVRYGRLKKDEKKSVEYQSVYFTGTSKDLKIYDKGKEIAAHTKDDKYNSRQKRREVMDAFQKNGAHFLRVEFTLKSQKSFSQYGLERIKCISDLIKHYNLIYEFWCRETARIILYNQVKPDPNKMSKTEFKKAMILELHGFEAAVEEVQKGINPNAKSASVGKSKALQKLLALIRKYDSPEYNTLTFRKDVIRELMRKHKQDAVFDVKSGVRAILSEYIKNPINK